MLTHSDYMKMCFSLARRGEGTTSPNPMVGAIIVNHGTIVGKGYHRKSGEKHAEIIAIEEAREKARGGTLYLNLEPCCHFGKTPPCCASIIEAGIQRVICAMKDPHPLINGRGLKSLREKGIFVEEGLLRREAMILNEIFIKYSQTGKPFVLAKVAMSLDGKISSSGGESKWISSLETRKYLHNRIRYSVDALMVGINTILMDDPLLTVRGTEGRMKKIKRIVLDSALVMPLNSRLMRSISEGEVYIYTTKQAKREAWERLEEAQAHVIMVEEKDGMCHMKEVIEDLGKRGITSVLIEGGSRMLSSALEAKVIDKAFFFLSPTIIHGKGSQEAIQGLIYRRLEESIPLDRWNIMLIGQDIMVQGYPIYG